MIANNSGANGESSLANRPCGVIVNGTNATLGALPLMSSDEVFGSHLIGLTAGDTECIIWRDASGRVNVWDDRCCHRGVRLSIGTHLGDEIKCRYHGWRFASAGNCSFIPAQPQVQPPQAARVLSYSSSEKYGLVWLHGTPHGAPPTFSALDNGPTTSLRSLVIHKSFALVSEELKKRFAITSTANLCLFGSRDDGEGSVPVLFALLPQAANKTTVHSVILGSYAKEALVRIARAHNDELKALSNA